MKKNLIYFLELVDQRDDLVPTEIRETRFVAEIIAEVKIGLSGGSSAAVGGTMGCGYLAAEYRMVNTAGRRPAGFVCLT